MKTIFVMLLLITGITAEEKMNVLFIAVDDLKPMLGCYGSKEVKSPSIDKLASEGTLFLNSFCQWPVCGGSRASLMTGLYPETTGVMDLKTRMRDVNENLLTLPQHFKNHGYETAGVGKIFDPRCVDNKTDLDKPSWSVPFTPLSHGKIKHRSDKIFASSENCADTDMTDGVIAAEGLKLMAKLAAGKKPFFLAVGFKKPHLPFQAPQKYWDLYDPNELKLAEFTGHSLNASAYGWNGSGEFRSYIGVPAKGEISDEIKLKSIHGYMACVSYIDAQVGKLLAELKKLKLDKNTVIVLWGDHGFHLGDHNLWGKHTVFEQAAAAPLIFSVPGHKPQKAAAPAGLIDIFPTLCEATGLKIPDKIEGKSLMPVINQSKTTVRTGIITQFKSKGAMGYSFRTKRYRYIEWIRKTELAGIELYDYQADPLEKVNIAQQSPDLVKEMAKALRAEAAFAKKLAMKVSKK